MLYNTVSKMQSICHSPVCWIQSPPLLLPFQVCIIQWPQVPVAYFQDVYLVWATIVT